MYALKVIILRFGLGLFLQGWAVLAAAASLDKHLLASNGEVVYTRLRMEERLGFAIDGAGKSAPQKGADEVPLDLKFTHVVFQDLRRSGDSQVTRPKQVPGFSRVKPAVPSRRFREEYLLDVTINDQKLAEVVHAEQGPEGSLLIPVDAWAKTNLRPPGDTVLMSTGTPAYGLTQVKGLTWQMDRSSQKLDIMAPASAFVLSKIGIPGDLSAPPPRPEPGMMLNYDLSWSDAGSRSFSGATFELVAFGQWGVLVNSALFSRADQNHIQTRLDSYWRYDLPHRMETLVVGDTVGVGGGWSRPARYGGIRWGRDFGTRPGFVTVPQLTMAGEATLPSTVDVLVNNARQLSQPVPPGPFDLGHVPVVNGAGEVSLVVRDLLGRETIFQQNYYASPRILAPGLTDFSFEAGWLRTGYGRDSRYIDGFGAATWRQGLTTRLTGELRAELQAGRYALGMDTAGLVGQWGVAHMALATASGGRQGVAETGYLFQAGIERHAPNGSGLLQYEYATRGFAPFGEALGLGSMAQRPRERWLATVGHSFGEGVSGGFNFVRQVRWDGDQVTSLGLTLGLPLWQRASLLLYANQRLDGDRGWYVGMNINLPLDGRIYTAGKVDRGMNGQLRGTVSAAQSPPAGTGLGWRVQAANIGNQRAQAGVQVNAIHSEWTMEAVAGDKGEVSIRIDGRGTVGRFNGLGFASRPVGDGSVAVVKVNGIEGVPIQYSRQVVTRTNAQGLAFVPRLLPWQKNRIEIDPVDLPLDVLVTHTTQEVTPYARSGVVVDFGARRSRQALVVLHQHINVPVPMGARVRLLHDGREFVSGRRGEVWLTDLPDGPQRLRISWTRGSCMLNLPAVPSDLDGTPGKIGPLTCEEESP